MEEAIHCKVPVLVIPFLGDQDANANRLEQLGVGLQLDLLKMNEINLRERIVELLKPKYRENMHNLNELVYDQPMTSLSKAIFWIEYVIRHKGAKHLEFKGKHVPFYQAYCLDFIAIFIALSIVSYHITRRIMRKVYETFPLRLRSIKNKVE
jgi:glucuronosyltransferase